MYMLIIGLPFALPGSDGLGATLEVDADVVGAGVFVEAVTEIGFRVASGATLAETGICGTREALGDGLSDPTAPIVRAVVEAAS